ncbi:DUF4179 domain-containing protein [Paenibacillus rhizovicinus]|uniref:DUF4179 domain-containing protein n=1 Tax=Paenibacillus rhizovicinus TaxID=2704463 RepID=A0A6C0NUX3_9BACL|nr:DUF4179 domain-containing protein [Paenibacillus rhizovicinus]QHW29911.1 DUF4179 domain-containing protein [Paenibacillus rhizovicinus]
MNTIEEKFNQHKENLNQIKAPSEMEDRLRQALHRVPAKKPKRKRAWTWSLTAAAALMLFVLVYQYPAFAYYGGKLLNRNDLYSLSFSELAEQGYGQTVGKSKTLKDGTVLTINGVIADDNAFLMYYTIDLPEGQTFKIEDASRFDIYKIKGFLTDSHSTEGGSNFNKDRTQLQGIQKFEPVSPFSRTLTVEFSEWLEAGTTEKAGKKATYPISFKFEANKAMKSMIQKDLAISVPVDQGKIVYDSITASPTATVIKGHYEMDNGEPPRYPGTTKLTVNGGEVNSVGMRTKLLLDKITDFELDYDVLPSDKIESMDIVLENFTGYQKVTEPISLTSPSDRSIRIGTEKVFVRSVTKTASGYDIDIARAQFTQLDTDHLFVQAGGKQVPIASISQARPWDLGNNNVFWEQTYAVKTADKPELLLLTGFHYIKPYKKTVSIPIGTDK